jgi:hypothetical protein
VTSSQPISALDPAIRYYGRIYRAGDRSYFDWPGTGFRLRITGSETVSLHMNGARNFFNVTVNGNTEVLKTDGEARIYPIATRLDPEQITDIDVCKRTEGIAHFVDGMTGCIEFTAVSAPGGQLLASQAQDRIMEFVGDSDTAAYGNLGERTGMTPEDRSVFADPSKQDASQSWAAIVAHTFEADCHNISYSGMGAVWNSPGHTADEAMDRYYFRHLVNPVEVSELELPPVDIVVLYIGGNDWWTLADKGDQPFIEGFAAFLREIRIHRRTQPILVLTANESSGSCLVTPVAQKRFSDDMRRVYHEAVSQAGGAPAGIHLREVVPSPAIDVTNDADWGLMEHWSALANRKWAKGVTPHVTELTGWSPAL